MSIPGGVVTQAHAARVLDVSRARITQLIRERRLFTGDSYGRCYVTCRSLEAEVARRREMAAELQTGRLGL